MSTNCLLLYLQKIIFDIFFWKLLRINLLLFLPTSDPFRRLLHVWGHRTRVRAGPDAAPWLGRGVREEGLGGTSSEPETSHAGQGKVFGAVVTAVLPSLELRFLFQGFEFRVLLAGFFRLHKVYFEFWFILFSFYFPTQNSRQNLPYQHDHLIKQYHLAHICTFSPSFTNRSHVSKQKKKSSPSTNPPPPHFDPPDRAL